MIQYNVLHTSLCNRCKLCIQDSDKKNKDIKYNMEKISSNELSLIRTELALNRTYEASIRTNAIFVGIAVTIMALMKKEKNKVIGIILIVFSLLINIISTIYYFGVLNSLPKSINNSIYEPIEYISIGYSIILSIFQIILIYIFFKY